MPLGGLITLLILLPNLIFLIYPPLEKQPKGDPKGPLHFLMETIERIGQIGTFLIPFFFKLPFLQFQTQRTASVIGSLIVMVLALAVYYTGWVRYIKHGRRACLLFEPMFKIPLPMALSPVIYFVGAAVLLQSFLMALAVIFLAVGHLFVSQENYRSCQQNRAL